MMDFVIREARAVVARVPQRIEEIHVPLSDVAGHVGLTELAIAFGRDRADLVHVAAAGLHAVVAVVKVRVAAVRRRAAPRINALLRTARRGVVPFGFAWQTTAVPNAEGLRLVPTDAVYR